MNDEPPPAGYRETVTLRRCPGWSFFPELEIEIGGGGPAAESVKLGLAVMAAVSSKADLSGANLAGAYLREAKLSGADLAGVDLSRACLIGADLSQADLSWADLSGADLSGARLAGANLAQTHLSRAGFLGADLLGADLSEANLRDEALRPFKADLWLTLLSLEWGAVEARHLVAKLRAGQVDGRTYGKGAAECACLVGTIAYSKGLEGVGGLDTDPSRPAERWFTMIAPGDRPGEPGGGERGGAYAARKALEWVLELCAITGVDPEDPQPNMGG